MPGEKHSAQKISFEDEMRKWDKASTSIILLLPMSGNNSAIGNSIIDTSLLASQKIKDVEFHIVDTISTDPIQLYEQTKHKNFKAIIGPVFYNEVRQYEAIFNNIPIFTLSNNIDVNNQHVFACGLSPQEELNFICKYIMNKKLNGITFLMPDNPYSEKLIKLAKSRLPNFAEDDINVIKYTSITKEDALRIAQSSKQAIFVLDPILNIETLPEEKYVFTLSASALSNKTAWNGAIFVSDNNKWRKDFIKRYKKMFKRIPTTIDMVAYDIIKAICTSETQADLFKTKFNGCFGEFVFSKKHGIQRDLHLYTLKNSEEISIEEKNEEDEIFSSSKNL